MANLADEKRWQEEPVDESFLKQPRAWLAKNMSDKMPWLLAHADDGVIWGKRQSDGSLKLSSDVFNDEKKYPSVAVPLSAKTLQQARIFGPAGEILIWRTDNGFAARRIDESSTPAQNTLPDEWHLLWGEPDFRECRDGFCLFIEGQQGLRHALPVGQNPPPANQRAKLCVRHYVAHDNEGQAYIAMSRLVNLQFGHNLMR
jgi:CRISPR-associated protein (TIGR03984 family)